MICYLERVGLFSGLCFNQTCPSLSHLFFADDSIIFCKVDLEHAKAIKNLLQDYARVLGQEVNFKKSALFFNRDVPHWEI